MDIPARRQKTEHVRDQIEFHGQGLQNNDSGHIHVGRDINIAENSNGIDTLLKLRLTDPRDDKVRIEQQKGGLLHGSYVWILDHEDFLRWRDDEGSRLLWIRGDPGKGKTMLLCGIINELNDMHKRNQNVIYYFCQATSNQLNKATSVLRGLISSLLSQRRELLESVRKDIDEAGEQMFQDMNGWAALCRIFNRLIEETEARQQTTYLIVDALDECLEGQSNLLKWIAALSSSRLRVLVSSRNWHSIESGLSSATRKIILQLELNANSISAAVDRYTDFKATDLARSKDLDTETRESVRQYLKSNSSNTFLWVALVCQKLGREDTDPWDVLDMLHKFPTGLDGLYERMANQFLVSKNSDICRQVLAAQALAYRPLSLAELLSLVESPEMFQRLTKWLRRVVELCGSFLTVKSDVVYFVHQSAKDYLIEHKSDFMFREGLHAAHHNVFRQLVQALSRTLQENIYELPSLGSRVDSIELPDPDPLSGIRYACVYWADHLENADLVEKQDLDNRGLVHSFLEEHLLHWLEALSLLKSLGFGIKALTKLSSLLRASKKDDQGLVDLLYDAGRFVRLHKIGIEAAPLQVYSSALIFSPTRSIVRKLFLKKPDWLLMSPTRDSDWSSCLQTLEGHAAHISSATFSPNGKYVASGSREGIIRIWDVATGGCVNILKGRTGRIYSIAFSPNSQHVASSAGDGTIRIWHAGNGICLQTFKGDFKKYTYETNYNIFQFVAFLDNESVIAVNGHGWGYKWNTKTGDRLERFQFGHRDDLQNPAERTTILCLSRSGRRAAWVSQRRGGIEVIDTVAGRYHDAPWYQELKLPAQSVVALSPDGEYMATTTESSEKQETQVWDVTKNLCIKTLYAPFSFITALAFSPNNKYLATRSGYRIQEWEIATGQHLVLEQITRDNLFETLEFSYDSTLLVSSSRDGKQVRVWEMATTRLQHLIPGKLGLVDDIIVQLRHMALSPSGRLLGLLDWNGMFRVWDTRKNKLLSEIVVGNNDPMVLFSPNGVHVACTSERNPVIEVFNAMSGHSLWSARTGYERTEAIAFSPDGSQLASLYGPSHTLLIWDVATGICLNTVPISISIESNDWNKYSLALSPDGTKVAIGHQRSVYIIPVSSPSSRLGTHAIEHEAQTRDAATGLRVFLPLSKCTISSVTFSPDSRYILTYDIGESYIICTVTRTILKSLGDFSLLTGSLWIADTRWVPAGIQTDRGIYDTQTILNDAKDPIIYDHDGLPSGALSGVGISETRDWILRNGEPYLWVPPENRPGYSSYDVRGNTIAFGTAMDRMYCIRLPPTDPA